MLYPKNSTMSFSLYYPKSIVVRSNNLNSINCLDINTDEYLPILIDHFFCTFAQTLDKRTLKDNNTLKSSIIHNIKMKLEPKQLQNHTEINEILLKAKLCMKDRLIIKVT